MFATITLALANAAGAYVTLPMVLVAAVVDIAWAGVAYKYVEERQ